MKIAIANDMVMLIDDDTLVAEALRLMLSSLLDIDFHYCFINHRH